MKKDVFVWVARGKTEGWDSCYLFESKPTFLKYHWLSGSSEGSFFSDIPTIKKGQCKKYKLVEVKESEV